MKSLTRRLSLLLILPLFSLSFLGCDDDELFTCSNDSATCLVEAETALEESVCACVIERDPTVSSHDQCVDAYFEGGVPEGADECLRALTASSAASDASVECAADAVVTAVNCVQQVNECGLGGLGTCIGVDLPANLDACGFSEDFYDDLSECMGDLLGRAS